MVLTVSEHINLTMKQSETVLNRFTYPVFVNQRNDRPDLIASSVAVELCEMIFLITASHVLDEVQSVESPFYLGVEQGFVALQGEFIRSKAEPRDNFDIAFLEIPRKFAEDHNIEWLGEGSVIVRQLFDSPHLTVVHGYPCSKNKQIKALKGGTKFKSYAYSYGGKVDKEFSSWEKFEKHEDFHICMSYGKARSSDGMIVTPPSPSGLSGGGLWIIPDSFKPESVYLTGIFIEYYGNDKVSFSTKMSKVYEFVRAYT